MGFLGLVKGLHVMALDALSANAPRPTPLPPTSGYRRAVPVAERQPAIRDRPSVAEPYVVGSGIPRRVEGLRSRGGTLRGLLAVCPARIIYRDRGALRHRDYDLSIVLSPVDGGKRAGWGSRLSCALADRQQAWDLRSWAGTLRTVRPDGA